MTRRWPERDPEPSPPVRGRKAVAVIATGAAAMLLLPAPALAHMPAGGSAFYGGLAHPYTDAGQALLILASGLLAGLGSEKRLLRTLAAMVAGLLLGGIASRFLGGLEFLVPVGMVLGGGAVALGRRRDDGVNLALGGALGLGLGAAQGGPLPEGWSEAGYLAGVVAAAAFGANLTAQLALRARAGFLPVALRVGGSWIAALGLMMFALALK